MPGAPEGFTPRSPSEVPGAPEVEAPTNPPEAFESGAPKILLEPFFDGATKRPAGGAGFTIEES